MAIPSAFIAPTSRGTFRLNTECSAGFQVGSSLQIATFLINLVTDPSRDRHAVVSVRP
jgi:hypothetical protein